MISKKLQKAINEQINFEMFSSYLYLSMSANLDSMGLKGGSNWMRVQAQEELGHIMKFYDHMLERKATIELLQIDKPQGSWDSVLEAFSDALKHEEIVTKRINALADLAIKESDHATLNFLQWFIAEQVEEEANVSDVIDKLNLVGNSTEGLFQVDKELGLRVYVPIVKA